MLALRRYLYVILSGLAGLCIAGTDWNGLGRFESVAFNRDIRPILSDKCFYCHGPDSTHRQANLRLDVQELAVGAGAIVPGAPDRSALMRRILSADPDVQMPPPDSHKQLSRHEQELLRQWIAEGAHYERHWAYLLPRKPVIPSATNAIDFLIAQRLRDRGWSPAHEADRRTLLRRLSFDLLGLPPTPEEVAAFADDTSPNAYARQVERLLASPHFGERMAAGWLDVVRYADTIGYHSDYQRNVWPYRDYVIRAFNTNKPFDEFTIEQLAGDLLPGSTQEQKVASGFNRLLLSTEEGGAQLKDYEARMLGDRVRAVGTAWLGQTVGCCQCHDHKFDPLTARDFYCLGAFFADINEVVIGRREEGMNVLDEQTGAELARLSQIVDRARQKLAADRPGIASAQAAWEAAALEEAAEYYCWAELKLEKATANNDIALKINPDNTVFLEYLPPVFSRGIYRIEAQTRLTGITGLRLEVLGRNDLPKGGPGRGVRGNFVLNEVAVTVNGQPVKLARARASFEQPGHPAAAASDGNLAESNGWRVFDTPGAEQALTFELAPGTADTKPDSTTTIVVEISQLAGGDQLLGHFRLSATNAPRPIRLPAVPVPPENVLRAIQLAPKRRNADELKLIADHFRQRAPELLGERTALFGAEDDLAAYDKQLPKCLVSSAAPPRTVRILPRGNWQDESGPEVEPALPAFLAECTPGGAVPAPSGQRLTRLDLARWIVSRHNPLTARVYVNRLWKQLFGVGLCSTLDDLGSQGEWPQHAELLDWLACEFMDSGWDVKHMVRLIVSTHAYRQVSTATAEQLARDPDNRLLARQGRFRLEAEQVRDNALAVSGLLVPKLGGPSVKPYQPAGYWENLNFPPRDYVADTGENQYRRGLYTWWQRSFLHPSMLAFDAPSREECAASRNRSNIPQQALVLLNDPTYVEAARALATKTLAASDTGDDEARIRWAWQQVLQRDPGPDEEAAIRELLEEQLTAYQAEQQTSEQLLHVGNLPLPANVDPGELAAWTDVARVLLNLHETITRN